jgi:hypothetical protein
VRNFSGVGDEHGVKRTDVQFFLLAGASNKREMATSRNVVSHRLPKLGYRRTRPPGNLSEIGKVVGEPRNNRVA